MARNNPLNYANYVSKPLNIVTPSIHVYTTRQNAPRSKKASHVAWYTEQMEKKTPKDNFRGYVCFGKRQSG